MGAWSLSHAGLDHQGSPCSCFFLTLTFLKCYRPVTLLNVLYFWFVCFLMMRLSICIFGPQCRFILFWRAKHDHTEICYVLVLRATWKSHMRISRSKWTPNSTNPRKLVHSSVWYHVILECFKFQSVKKLRSQIFSTLSVYNLRVGELNVIQLRNCIEGWLRTSFSWSRQKLRSFYN